jgi:uncharacterized protein (TIGR00266 family)
MSGKIWFAAVSGQQQGPFTEDELRAKVVSGEIDRNAHVFKEGMSGWVPITDQAEFSSALPSTPPPPTGGTAHVIDYEIFGEEMQFVEITLDPQEACVAEAGSFMYMDPGIEMETMFGDGSGSQQGGLMGALLGAGKRVLTGESLFMTLFGNIGGSRQKVAFASPYPGRIIPLDLKEHNGTVTCQKDAFLCAAKGVAIDIAFQKRLGAGLFGGEGFILQKLTGDGLAFVHAGGTVVDRTLAAGETMRLDTGCLVAMESQITYDIQMVKGIKTALFGGEGLFYASLTGPGKVWIQSLPFSRLASRVYAAAPQTGGTRKGEGSVLGGLGDLVMGD